MANIMGILKEDVTINKITYKAGTELSVPEQYGLSEYFKEFKEEKIKREVLDNDNIKTNR